MKIFILSLLILLSSARADDLAMTIKKTIAGNKNADTFTELKPQLLKIEYFLNSSKIKDQNAIFQTEFINFFLKNPILKEINRYPIRKETLKDELSKIELKSSELSPIARVFASRITLEIRGLASDKNFAKYLNRILKSYYFTTNELKIIDKKMRFIEPWWKFYLTYSPKDINQLFYHHLKNFIIRFSASIEFILNSKIEIPLENELTIFVDQSRIKSNPIEDKLDEIIDHAQKLPIATSDNINNLSEDLKDDWSPKDEIQANLDSFQNLNIPANYPKPSPNYTGPEELPVPMNDW